jgi:hypothetical protein
MTDSGLSTRLRQQSRRAGLMVGMTMVLTIAICVFGAAGLFAWLSRPFSDLIPMVAPAAQIAPTDDADPAAAPDVAPTPPAAEAPPETPDTVSVVPTEAPAAGPFTPSHQISAAQSVNFRSGPSTGDPVIVALSPATPLQYLEEDEPTTNPADGDRWMKFRTEDGQEGWVLEILTEPYQP